MESDEVIRQAVAAKGAKAIASELGVSQSLVHKWSQSKQYHAAAADNPLDRVLDLHRITGDDHLLEWLCSQTGGSFVRHKAPTELVHSDLLIATQGIVGDFSDMLSEISRSTRDGIVSPAESQRIRDEWEELKSTAESFVRSCEKGTYHKKV